MNVEQLCLGVVWVHQRDNMVTVASKKHLGNGSVKNAMINRDFPYLTDLLEKETLDILIWEEIKDGLGTGVFANSGGYAYWDMDTGIVPDNNVVLNSTYRWQCIPSKFGDADFPLNKLVAEFLFRLTNPDLSSNQYVTFGFTEDKDNNNDAVAGNDIAAFVLKAVDTLNTRTSINGTDEDWDVSAGITLTDFNLYRIEAYQMGYKFYINGALKATHEIQVPDIFAYLLFGTRAEGAAATGFDRGICRVRYEEA